MKTINLNKKSWHYWLAVNIANFKPNSGDFCSYVRNVIWGAFLVLLLAAIALFFGSIFIGGLIQIGIYVFDFLTGHAYKILNSFTQSGALVDCMLVVCVIIGFTGFIVKEKMEERRYVNRNADTPDSFIKNAYLTFKNKVCFKVNFK